MRTYLEVPYKDKDQAKRLGAWWDSSERKWFVENVEDLRPFLPWVPKHLLKPCR